MKTPPTANPACFGICCELRGRCQHYAAVETAQHHAGAITTCNSSGAARPLFQAIQPPKTPIVKALCKRLTDWFIARATKRPPDFIIGGAERPYIRRWWVIPRNRWFNVYLHHFMRSDDDRALHDHPWANCSVLLRGRYIEHTIAAGGINHRRELKAGQVRLRLSGKFAHRIDLPAGPVWTLFITGPKYREWGFHCPDGWVHWETFTATDDRGAIGRGCAQ